MKRRQLLQSGATWFGAAALAGAGVPAPAHAASRSLTVTSFGGTFQQAEHKEIVVPFEKAENCRVSVVTAVSTRVASMLLAANGHPGLDVVDMNQAPMYIVKRHNLLQKLDLEKIPNAKRIYPIAIDKEGYWIGSFIATTGLAYNTEKLKTPPTSWLDLWKPEYKGHVALPDITQGAGYEFLVEIARLHGGSAKDIDPGFKAIKELSPSVVTYYKEPDAMSRLLTSGEAWLGPWYNDRFNQLKHAGAPVGFVRPKEGAIALIGALCVPVGAPDPDLAMRYINFAIGARTQGAFDQDMGEAPTNRDVVLPPSMAASNMLPYGAKVVESLVALDQETISAELPNWISRWEREITG
ncbi:MAG: ABC transporter substrate-binding protein [Acetobacteraceae bacterium]